MAAGGPGATGNGAEDGVPLPGRPHLERGQSAPAVAVWSRQARRESAPRANVCFLILVHIIQMGQHLSVAVFGSVPFLLCWRSQNDLGFFPVSL